MGTILCGALPGLYLKERKTMFNAKWQAPSNSPSQWASKNHAYSMDLIFIGKSQGWQRGSLNFFLCFCFLSSVVSHVWVWHHMHKNTVYFTYLYLCTHVSTLYVIILYLWHQLLRKIDLEYLILVDFLSNRQREERERESEGWHMSCQFHDPLRTKKR